MKTLTNRDDELIVQIQPRKQIEYTYSKRRIQRALDLKKGVLNIATAGTVATVAIGAMKKLSGSVVETFMLTSTSTTQPFKGWALIAVGGTLVLAATYCLLNGAWWKVEDREYKKELRRLVKHEHY